MNLYLDTASTLYLETAPQMRQQLEDLMAAGLGAIDEVVRIAVERLWIAECRRSDAGEHVQLWEHRTSGKCYAVLFNGGVVGAYGPLTQAESEQVKARGLEWACDWSAELAAMFAAN